MIVFLWKIDVIFYKNINKKIDLYVEQAPEPNDVDWEFIHCKTKERLVARFKWGLVTLGLMMTCFTIIWGLSFWASTMTDKAHDMLMNGEPGAARN